MASFSDFHRFMVGGNKSESSQRAQSQQESRGLSSSLQQLFGPQAQALAPLFGYTGDVLNQYQQNPQQLTPGFTQAQLQGQQGALEAAQTTLPDLFNQSSGAYQDALNAPDVMNNPFFQQNVQATLNPFIRSFMQDVIPGLRSQAVGVGQAGGSREGIAQGIATQGLQDKLGELVAQMGSNAYGQGLQARQGALGISPQIAQLGLLPSQTQMGIGAQQQALQQQQALAPFILGQNVQSVLGSPITLGSSFSTDYSRGTSDSAGYSKGQGNRGFTQGAADMGQSFGGVMGGLFSDRRLKKNIRKVSEHKGLSVYIFDYLWGQKSIGYMADEVKEKYPDAVINHSGYDMVMYGAI